MSGGDPLFASLDFWQWLVGTAAGVLVAFFGGLKWLLVRADRKDKELRDWQTEERKKLEAQFSQHIAHLRELVAQQEVRLASTQRELDRYIHRVGILEGIMHTNNLPIPPMSPHIG